MSLERMAKMKVNVFDQGKIAVCVMNQTGQARAEKEGG